MTPPLGLYKWVKMIFGLKNAAQTLQRFNYSVIMNLTFSFANVQDLVNFKTTPEEHKLYFTFFLKDFKQYDLQINPNGPLIRKTLVWTLNYRSRYCFCARKCAGNQKVPQFSYNHRFQKISWNFKLNIIGASYKRKQKFYSLLNSLYTKRAFDSTKKALTKITLLSDSDSSEEISITFDKQTLQFLVIYNRNMVFIGNSLDSFCEC